MIKIPLGNLVSIKTGKLDANAMVTGGEYPFFTCAREIYQIDNYVFEGESILVAGNGDLNVKYYDGKFNAYQRTYVLQKPLIDGKFLYYVIEDNLQLLRSGSRGSTIKYIRLGDLQNMQVPLFSFQVQKSIVQEIEKQFSRLDDGLNSLKRTKENLKRYKASVLKSAVEGKLTKNWRESQIDLEPASKLLEIILEEKKRNFLDKNPKKKYKEPEGIKKEYIPQMELPEKWCWSNFGQVSEIESNLVCVKGYENYFFVAPDHIQKYSGILLEKKYVKDLKIISQKHLFEANRIIYSKIRPNLSKLIISDEKGLCSADMYPINFYGELKYLFYYMLSENFLNYSTTSGSRTILPKINQKELNKISIPLPPLKEQNQIVKKVEEKLSVIEQLEKIIDDNIKKAENLKQSILKKAFEGRLVEIGGNEEKEVEKLIEEIRIEKERMEKEEKEAKKLARKKK